MKARELHNWNALHNVTRTVNGDPGGLPLRRATMAIDVELLDADDWNCPSNVNGSDSLPLRTSADTDRH